MGQVNRGACACLYVRPSIRMWKTYFPCVSIFAITASPCHFTRVYTCHVSHLSVSCWLSQSVFLLPASPLSLSAGATPACVGILTLVLHF